MTDGPVVEKAQEVVGERREIWIELDGVRDRLRIPGRGKLILKKWGGSRGFPTSPAEPAWGACVAAGLAAKRRFDPPYIRFFAHTTRGSRSASLSVAPTS